MRGPPIITTDVWGARPPKQPIPRSGRPRRIIFHHTQGHAPDIDGTRNESRAEAIRYAREIQSYHMDVNGWLDSGHNFLVCRNGLILVGRHGSYPAVRAGRMVVSAHCPGQNEQPGIEHEHIGGEYMTAAQFEASAQLHAWIIWSCGMGWRLGVPTYPHRLFYATDCPGVLLSELPALRHRVRELLRQR